MQIGDVVLWSQVPSGALVGATEREFSDMYALRSEHHCCWVTVDGWRSWDDDETWVPHQTSQWRIIAADLSGQETAAELQRLAEIFEVREAFVNFFNTEDPADLPRLRSAMMLLCDGAAEVLHAAGWRRGMSLAQAHHMLSEA